MSSPHPRAAEDFLSDAWVGALNDTLRAAPLAALEGAAKSFRVVFDFTDAPPSRAHALTLEISPEGSTAKLDDVVAGDAVVRLSFDDGLALATGTLDSASALREGRLKVSGDVPALVNLLNWFHEARTKT